MEKRGQLSVFIILAIVIVAAIGLFFLFQSSISDSGKEVIDPQIAPVYSFVENCVLDTAYEAVYFIGDTGGYYNLPELSTSNNVAYYYYDRKNYLPTKERIEEELALYVENALFFCVKDFKDFPDYEVKQGNVVANAVIEDQRVVFNVMYPISITKEGRTYSFKSFKGIEVPVRLGVIYDLLYKTMDEQMKQHEICISCLNNLAVEKDLYVDMNDYGENTVLFTVIDENSKIKGEGYRFYFANKY